MMIPFQNLFFLIGCIVNGYFIMLALLLLLIKEDSM